MLESAIVADYIGLGIYLPAAGRDNKDSLDIQQGNLRESYLMKLKHTMAASIASALVFSASAYAGADEIDILKAELELLNQRVKQLEMTGGKEYTQKGNDKLWLRLSGQVHRGFLWGDNEHNEQTFHVDVDNSSSRFRIEGGADYNSDISIGTNIEIQAEHNSTADATFESNEVDADLSTRVVEFFVKHARWGTFTFGQGWMAAALSTSVDLSGSDIAVYSSVADMAGGLRFNQESPAGVNGLGPRVSDVFSTLEAFFRRDRFRYDSPVWNGWFVSFSFAQDRAHDIALRYSEMWNDIKIAMAIAYAEENRDDDPGRAAGGIRVNNQNDGFDVISGSLSVLFPSGWSLTFAASQRDLEDVGDLERDKANMYYAKLGYLFHYFSVGQTAVAIDWFRNDDFYETYSRDINPKGAAYAPNPRDEALAVNSDELVATAWGIGLVQNIDPLAMQVHTTLRNYDLDTGDIDHPINDEIWAWLLGARIKF